MLKRIMKEHEILLRKLWKQSNILVTNLVTENAKEVDFDKISDFFVTIFLKMFTNACNLHHNS